MWKMPNTRKKDQEDGIGRDIPEQDVIIYICSSAKMYLVLFIVVYLVPAGPQTAQHPNALAKGWVLQGSQARASAPPHPPHLSVGALSCCP